MKTCSRCKKEKPLHDFSKNSTKKHGRQSYCRECKVEYQRNYRLADKEKYSKLSREYYKANKEKIAKRYQEYYKANKERIIAKQISYNRARYKNENNFVVSKRLSGRIWCAFAGRGWTKRGRSAELVGCSWDELKLHIERQFLRGMTWDNRSEWHIDHIVPLASASTPEEMEALCHYTNLRPIWAKDNLKKHAKTEFLI